MTNSAPRSVASDSGLAELSRRIERDLELLDYPRRPWLTAQRTPSGDAVHDVVIVGGGQSGLTAAFGLMRERVGNLIVLDENPLDRAGPWLNFARMRTLRTPKYLTGPDLGIPSLTTRAWYEAQFGEGSWETLGLLPKELWANYLAWYRQTLHIPVEAETKVGALEYDESAHQFLVPCTGPGGTRRLRARRVVLATGIDGSGEWRVPRAIAEALPTRLYAHTRDAIDFDALRGKRIAVLGAGASGFDNAATALELGAHEVHLLFRRPQLVNVNAYRWAEFVGFLKHHADLPDPEKWRFISQILRMGQLPPKDTLARAQEHAGFHLHADSSWKSITHEGDTVHIATESAHFEVDFVIVATGCVTDLAARPELANFEAHIARWADRYTPPAEERHEDLLRHPYLGPSFEFCERHPGQAPYLARLYNYTFGGLLSMGFGGASISGLKYSAPRLVAGITRSLFTEDHRAHYDSLCHFEEREF
ncbi:MAG TPA: NAD(P)/FAD-dependent oxidoreductase [Polyangiaceae bacterium]|nr:NAD(P)/FAD-dependent oxidoreductase [Polyangiaceae bacterium]